MYMHLSGFICMCAHIWFVFASFQAVNGGLVMVAFYPHFLSCSSQATLDDVIGM